MQIIQLLSTERTHFYAGKDYPIYGTSILCKLNPSNPGCGGRGGGGAGGGAAAGAGGKAGAGAGGKAGAGGGGGAGTKRAGAGKDPTTVRPRRVFGSKKHHVK